MSETEATIRHVEGREARGNTIITTRVIRSHDWPTREEWAKQERTWTRYLGDDDPVHVSGKVSDYLRPHEIAALIASLKARRSQLGKELREAKKQRPQAFRQKSETKTEWIHRWYQLSKEDEEVDIWTEPRAQLFRAVKVLSENGIPTFCYDGGNLPELAELKKRWQAAYDAEEKRIEDEYASRPIDDEAWEKELARRAEIERIDALPDSEWLVQGCPRGAR